MIMGGGDKKKVAALIVARVKPAGDIEDMKASNREAYDTLAKEPGEAPRKDEGKESAAEEMLSAIHDRDVDAFIEALDSYLLMSGYTMQDDEEEATEEKAEA
jgi:hypothetical protein